MPALVTRYGDFGAKGKGGLNGANGNLILDNELNDPAVAYVFITEAEQWL